MRKPGILVLLAMVLLCCTDGLAQRQTKVEQRQAFNCDERTQARDYVPGYVDWAVYFRYPENVSRVVVNSRGEIERAVLSRSEINYNEVVGGVRYVKVVTGGTARKKAKYTGSRQAWADSLRLIYYAPFQPRGRP